MEERERAGDARVAVLLLELAPAAGNAPHLGLVHPERNDKRMASRADWAVAAFSGHPPLGPDLGTSTRW